MAKSNIIKFDRLKHSIFGDIQTAQETYVNNIFQITNKLFQEVIQPFFKRRGYKFISGSDGFKIYVSETEYYDADNYQFLLLLMKILNGIKSCKF